MRLLPGSALWLAILTVSPGALAQGIGISPDGQKGRIHEVVRGDTLWDITDTYLGTAWAWPSIWKENEGIADPHLIYPGDLIWITEGEMRKLTPEEASRFMRAAAAEGQATPPAAPDVPAVPPAPSEPAKRPDPFAALDSSGSSVERYVDLEGAHRFAFVEGEDFARGTAAIVGTHRPSYWSSQSQRSIVSIGEGQGHVGDVFTVFRVRRRLLHPDSAELLGYFVEVLGIGELVEIDSEASFMEVTTAYAEIQPGDRIMRYQEQPARVREIFSDTAIEGQVVAYQTYRLRSGEGDLVILDQGSDDGVESGRRFELFRAGREVRDPLTLSKVLVPRRGHRRGLRHPHLGPHLAGAGDGGDHGARDRGPLPHAGVAGSRRVADVAIADEGELVAVRELLWELGVDFDELPKNGPRPDANDPSRLLVSSVSRATSEALERPWRQRGTEGDLDRRGHPRVARAAAAPDRLGLRLPRAHARASRGAAPASEARALLWRQSAQRPPGSRSGIRWRFARAGAGAPRRWWTSRLAAPGSSRRRAWSRAPGSAWPCRSPWCATPWISRPSSCAPSRPATRAGPPTRPRSRCASSPSTWSSADGSPA